MEKQNEQVEQEKNQQKQHNQQNEQIEEQKNNQIQNKYRDETMKNHMQNHQHILMDHPFLMDESHNQNQNDENLNSYIYSHTKSTQINSFVDKYQPYIKICPPPKYFPKEILLQQMPTDKREILKGLKYRENCGGLVCVDQEAMEKQKGVLVDVFKQFTINLLKGLTIAHISMPIKIFEPRSSIQRIVDLWSQAPNYLKRASETDDHLERFKLVIAFCLSSVHICSGQYKPFNPLLGETLQAQFSDGTQVYCEHTSHHPPITNFQVDPPNNEYKLWGYYEFVGHMGANNFKSALRGPNNVKFKDGQLIRYQVPDWKLGGTVMGDRTIESLNSIIFEDLTNNRKAVLFMNTYKKSGYFRVTETGKKDEFNGFIYETFPIDKEYSDQKNFCKNPEIYYDVNYVKDIKSKICDIEGSWLEKLVIDNKVYWDINVDVPYRFTPIIENTPNVLGETKLVSPSDWRYREDLIWLKYNFIKIAQTWKIRLEQQQRHDRALRQYHAKHRKRKHN